MSIVADVAQTSVEVVVAPAPKVQLWRLSVKQYHAMLHHGILSDGDPVELLDGILVAKMTKSTAHSLARKLVHDALAAAVCRGWYVDEQDAITLSTSEPEPDVIVIRGQPRDYEEHHPEPSDLALVVEVSDTSLRQDRGFKKSVYAAAAIPVYWIVNLVDRQIEVYTDPTGPGDPADYRKRQDVSEAEHVPVVIADREVARIDVRNVLPRPAKD
jgi:Uma2 family endonuclease